ncbi:hypothetical protein PY093_20445 [Cytobacillus sp. S13-E01]|uniref:hypothetical protein n=1 Tax=Cytobacillus sp. S13-E01 TaxID=3031326 RepID=UPI0023D8A7F2|nr:hypothetical protein [Cytobacillus sp. S13-E01]MDF0728986.1 hypothetical protein [Cytobacillus sp. S13-E01]
MDLQFTWSSDWIQNYESPWGILEKFRWANAIDGNTVLELIGNENVKKLKMISNAGSRHRSIIYFSSIDPKRTETIFGIDLKEYNDKLIDKLIHIIPKIKSVSNYFYDNITYCPICLSKGYHSIFHQIKFFDYCAFHPNQKLKDKCLHCKQTMPEYLINKGNLEAYRCSCGYCFLDSENIRSMVSSWKEQLKVQNSLINSWLKIPRYKVHTYNILYPFDNYKKYLEVDKKDSDYLRLLPKLLTNAFNEGALNNTVIKISSKENIFNIKNDYQQLKNNYMEVFPHRFYSFEFKEKHRIDSIYFEIYKQSRILYKAINRYILRKVIKEHNNCVKIFNKARQNGDVCPHAYAFILWKMECEGIDALWKIENQSRIFENLGFSCMNEDFSIFLHGSFMTHLEEILNPITRNYDFNFLNCNVSSINYILNRTISHLLIERYIKWLEVVHDPEKFKHTYPDDNIPMYIAKIPENYNEEISLYFPNKRINHMKSIIMNISNQYTCPFHRSKRYPRYKSPIRIAMDNM